MISVLIPVYNCFVDILVKELHRQASQAGREFEIIISDDGSLEEFRQINAGLQDLPGVQYFQQEKDLKRAGNRNFLGQQAKFRYLLFIDGDARVASENFIEKYLACCEGKIIVCGGTGYQYAPPGNPEYFLRWFYGWQREVRSATTRNQKPGTSFSAFNFLIEKSVFLENRFHEEIRDYGHEDTIFGLNLAEKGHQIRHIDNILIHAGIESNREFMDKSLQAVANLQKLMQDKELGRYMTGITIARWYIFCKKTGISFFLKGMYPGIRKLAEHNLFGRRPKLFLFDLYRLSYMYI